MKHAVCIMTKYLFMGRDFVKNRCFYQCFKKDVVIYQ